MIPSQNQDIETGDQKIMEQNDLVKHERLSENNVEEKEAYTEEEYEEFNRLCKAIDQLDLGSIKNQTISPNILNLVPFMGDTALGHAVTRGNIEIIRYLIENGANPVLKARDGETAFFEIIELNDLKLQEKIIKLFLDKRIAINELSPDNGTILHKSIIYNKNIDIIDLLITNGADVNTINSSNKSLETPLHIAVKINRIDIVKSLIAHDAKINAENNEDKTPLDLANEYNYFEIRNYLINSGAIANFSSKQNNVTDVKEDFFDSNDTEGYNSSSEENTMSPLGDIDDLNNGS